MIGPINTLRNFLRLLLIPLSFLPAPIQVFFSFLISVFVFYFVGKILKWVWDLLPIA